MRDRTIHTLLSGVAGSTAYGLDHAGSDVDRIAVFAYPTVEFLRVHPPTTKQLSANTTKPDAQRHEAVKAVQLMLNGNPSITEILWLDSYEVCTELGAQLVDIRGAFGCAERVRQAYLGYARDQFDRLVNTGQFKSTYRARTEKHARHVLRLLVQGLGFYETGSLTLRVDDPERFHEFGRDAAKDPEHVRKALAEYTEKFARARSPLPDSPDYTAVEAWLLRVRAAYMPQSAAA